MDHNEIRHSLTGYLDESLGPEDRAEIEEHLKTCSSCNLSLLEFRKTLEHIRSLEQVDPPPWMTQKIMARVRETAEKKAGPARAWFFRGSGFPIEALGIMLLTVTVFLIYRSTQTVDRLSERAAVQTVAPAPEMVLKDGSEKFEKAPPASTEPQMRADKNHDNGSLALSRQAAPPESARSAAKPLAAPDISQSNDAGAIQKKSADLKTQFSESAGKMLLVRIRARGNESLKRIEEAVRVAGGAVVSRDVSSDASVMTLQIDQSRHTALLNALRRLGKTEERVLAIDGREGREILMKGFDGPKAAAGC